MSDDLYRTPRESLERELAHLKDRVKLEKADVARFEGLAAEKDEGLARLVEDARSDVKRTESLIVEYREAIRSFRRGRR